jgi:hypothetical protein
MTPQNGEPPAGEETTGESNPDNASKIARELHWLEKLNIAGQMSLVIVGIIAASIYGCQLSVMRGTLTEMKRSGEQSTEQVWSAVGNINWMAKSMDESQKSTYAAMQQEIDKLNLQAGALKASAEQASRLADETHIANQNVIEADRPWFGIALTAQDPLEVGKIPSATVTFVNSGKRPARVLIAEVTDHWFTVFPENPPYEVAGIKSSPVPNSVVTNKLNLFKQPLSQPEIDAANGGAVKFFLYANITYVDLRTHTTHFTHSCWIYAGDNPVLNKGFYNCSEYQEAN